MAEGGGLLNRYTVKSCIGGSNPPLSAITLEINHLADRLSAVCPKQGTVEAQSEAQPENTAVFFSQVHWFGLLPNGMETASFRIAASASGVAVLM